MNWYNMTSYKNDYGYDDPKFEIQSANHLVMFSVAIHSNPPWVGGHTQLLPPKVNNGHLQYELIWDD